MTAADPSDVRILAFSPFQTPPSSALGVAPPRSRVAVKDHRRGAELPRLHGKARPDCSQSPLRLWHGRCNPKPRMRSCITSPTRGRAWFKAHGLQHGCCRRTRLPELTWLAPSANSGPSWRGRGPGSLAGSAANLHYRQHRAPRDPAPKDPLALPAAGQIFRAHRQGGVGRTIGCSPGRGP